MFLDFRETQFGEYITPFAQISSPKLTLPLKHCGWETTFFVGNPMLNSKRASIFANRSLVTIVFDGRHYWTWLPGNELKTPHRNPINDGFSQQGRVEDLWFLIDNYGISLSAGVKNKWALGVTTWLQFSDWKRWECRPPPMLTEGLPPQI